MSRIAERAEAEANYQQWSERLGRLQRDHWYSPGDRITAALTHAARAGGARRRSGRDPVLHPQRSNRHGDGPVPTAGPADRPVAARLDGEPDDAVVGRRPDRGRHLHDDRRDGVVRRRRRRSTRARSPPATPFWCSPARPIARAPPPPTCSASSRSHEALVPRDRGCRRAADRARARHDGSVGRAVAAQPRPRPRVPGAALRPARLRPIGCRIPVRSASISRSATWSELLDGRRALVFGHSYGGNVALAAAARHPELVVAVAVYETPLSWLDWWPGTTAGADGDRDAGRSRPTPPSGSCGA